MYARFKLLAALAVAAAVVGCSGETGGSSAQTGDTDAAAVSGAPAPTPVGRGGKGGRSLRKATPKPASGPSMKPED